MLFNETIKINEIINQGRNKAMSEIEFFEKEIQEFLLSPVRKDMFIGENYYLGDHDIKRRKRTVIGKGGKLEEIYNLPNNRLIDNQYSKMIDQKVNYILTLTN